MVAVTMERLGEALAALDPEGRALLDLNLHRGIDEREIAGILNIDAAKVAERRESLLERLSRELGLHTREQRDELQATLPDLPARVWQERR
jgi:DNA-directed RNA polymerase specialized sigma24 family protein